MRTPHQPSRRQAILFFFGCLLLAAFVIFWTFFLNKGILKISGDAPFRAQFGGETLECPAAPCIFKLTPRKYAITLAKDGFFDDSEIVEIKFRNETEITARFRFVPILREVGELMLPIPTAPLISPFLGTEKPENFPANSSRAFFSSSGKFVLVESRGDFYIYDAEKLDLKKIAIESSTMPVWIADNLFYIEDENSGQVLKRWAENGSEDIVRFQRAFDDASLIGGNNPSKLLIEEKDGAARIYYLIDTEKRTRRRIETEETLLKAKMLSSRMVFETQDANGQKKIFLTDFESQNKTEIPAVDIENIIENGDGIILFIASAKQDGAGGNLQYSISEIVEEARNENFNIENQNNTLFLTEFDARTASYRTIAKLPVEPGERINRLTLAENGGKILFEKAGKLFELILEKPE